MLALPRCRRATRSPGKYSVAWDGKDDAGKALPQGTYTVNLYFCETFDGIAAAGDRVFDVKIADKQLKVRRRRLGRHGGSPLSALSDGPRVAAPGQPDAVD